MSDRTCRHCGFAEREHKDVNKLCPVYVTFDARGSLEDENARLAALVEWYGLVLRAGNRGIVWWRSRTRLGIGDDSEPFIEVDAAGLPVEKPGLRSALLAAIGEPNTTAGSDG